MRATGAQAVGILLVTGASIALTAPARSFAATLSGAVIDDNGAPIAGARVDIASAGPKLGPGLFCPTCYVDCAKSTTTDAAGQFEIRALSDALKFRVLASADGRRTHITELIDPAVRPLAITLAEAPRDVPAIRTVRGLVVDEQDYPIEGALVSPGGAEMGSRRWWGRVDDVDPVVTNAAGRFAMFVPEGMTAVDLGVEADGLAGATTELTPAGADEARIVVPRGARITGRLVGDDGPRAGAQIAVVQIERTAGTHFIGAVAATTDADGRFEMSALPAAQEYAIFSPVGQGLGDGWVIASRRLRIAESGSVRDVGELQVEPGLTFAGRLKPQGDAALPKGIKLSLGREPAWDLIELPVDDQGRFELAGLPAESYTVRIAAPDWELVADELPFQALDENSFGMPLDESLDDIQIPLRRKGGGEVAASAESPRTTASEDAAATPATPSTEAGTSDPAASNDDGSGATQLTRTIEPTLPGGPTLNLAGRVVDEAGAPVSGAKVVLRAKLGGEQFVWGSSHNRDILATATTGRTGRFLLPNIGIPPRMNEIVGRLAQGEPGVELLGSAEGYGLKWIDVASLDPQPNVQIVLAPEADVRGTLRSTAGDPAAGARIVVWGLTKAASAIDGGFRAAGDLNLTRCEFSLDAVADAEGRFEMKRLPRDYRVAIGVMAPGFEPKIVVVNTAPDAQPSESRSDRPGAQPTPVLPSPLDLALTPTPTLRVRVLDAAGQPVPGGNLMLVDAERHYGGEASVDADGVALASLRSTGRIDVHYEADPFAPRLTAKGAVEIKPGERGVAELELRLPPERWLTGRVVDADTGAGVGGAYVSYGATAVEGDRQTASSTAVSGADGAFRIPVVAGAGALSFRQPLVGYLPPYYYNRAPNSPAMEGVPVEIPEAGDPPPVELKLARGLVVHGRALTESGSPIADAKVVVQNTDRPLLTAVAATDHDGKFAVGGVSPHVEAVVTVFGGGAGLRTTIAGDPRHPWAQSRHEDVELTIKRGLALAGRVLRGGQPAPDVRMALFAATPDNPDRTQLFATAITDAQGKYSIAGLPAGVRYYFQINAGGATDPAWTHQMPYAPTVRDEPDGVIELPDVNLVEGGQTLAGIVLDTAGLPVAGATVSAQLASGMGVPRPREGPPPWMTTAADGRFSLTDLPAAPLQLMAYVANPAGGRIHFPARITPQRNQTNVRIVLDPRLTADLPEL